MRISDWSSDVCSSDLRSLLRRCAIVAISQRRRLILPSSPTTIFRHSLRKGIGASAGRSRLPDLLRSRSISMAAIVLALPFPALNWSASSRLGANLAHGAYGSAATVRGTRLGEGRSVVEGGGVGGPLEFG